MYDIVSNIYANLDGCERSEICEFLDKYKLVDQDLDLHKLGNEDDEKTYKKIKNILNIITPHFIDKNGCVLGGDFVGFLRNIFDAFDMQKTTQKMYDYYLENGDLENQKIYEKINEKIEDILNVFEEETKNEKLAFSEFVVLLNNVFDGTKLSVVPLGVDQVFVGDVSKSFFENGKIFFLCGANQDRMPDFQKDVGLISDKDIARFSGKVKIDPTIRTINLRKRLKLCSVLSIPKQKLFVSWVALGDDGKKLTESTFVLGLVKMFAENVQKIGFAGDIQSEDFAKQISNSKRAKRQLINYLLSPNIQSAENYNSLFYLLSKNDSKIEQIVSQINRKNTIKNLSNSDVLLKKKRFSVSGLETYAKCPFKYYVEKGLGITEKRPIDLDPILTGNIVHFVLEKYFSAKQTKDPERFVEFAFGELSKKTEYAVLFGHKKFKYGLDRLKKECVKTIKDIVANQSVSKFKISNLEFVVRGDGFDEELTDLAFFGVVDRIDRLDDKAIVIDYKTGKVDRSSKNFYYGNKIQIFVYCRALEKFCGLKTVGAFYAPISNKKLKKKYEGYLLEGELENFDPDYSVDGGVLGLNLTSKKQPKKTKNFVLVNENNFENRKNYAVEIMKTNLRNIKAGFINCSPQRDGINQTCDNCKFLGVCQFDMNGANRPRIIKSVSDSFWEKK